MGCCHRLTFMLESLGCKTCMQGKIHPVFIANQEPYDVFNVFCTGASQYAPYNLLLISSKFWMGGGRWGVGGGEARGPSWRGRIRRVEGRIRGMEQGD